MKLLIPILLAFSVTIFSQNYKQIKLFINSEADLQKAYSLDLDLEEAFFNKSEGYTLFVNENEFRAVAGSGLAYEILINDWDAYYNSLPVLTEVEKNVIKMNSSQDFGVTGFDFGSMGGYYTLAEIEADLDEMFQLFPNLITQRDSIGSSQEGRTIWAVKISDNPNLSEDEPGVGFDALVHAREPQSMATLMYFMWYLLENYGTDPEVTYLVNNREIYCVPCFNPDGYEYNHQTHPNGSGMWRKNRRNNGSGCYGVDLNRNFGYMWGYNNSGSSPDPCAETYRGPSAFSEPESQAVRDLAILKNYGTHFNMHSYGNYYLYPWGYIDQETADSLTYREFAGDMSAFNGYAFGTGQQLLGYTSNGSVRDWMYGEQTVKNKIFGYTIEIGPDFWPNQSQIFPIAQINVKSNMYHAFVAGEYVQLVNPNFNKEYFLPYDYVELMPEVKNKGLAAAYNLTFELTSPSQYVTINTGNASMDSLGARSSAVLTEVLSFTISNSAPLEEEIPIVLTTRINGDISARDTTTIIIGFPVYIFEDLSNDPNVYWTITATPSTPKWEATTESFFSAPNSYTDSKNQNYKNNATVTMSLINPINLVGYTNPRLTFRTKFAIESDYDYGQVKVSTNNGSTWIPLQGQYTEPGVSPQPAGQPVYDGSITNWVKEEISLANYISSQLKIQFQLKTDPGVTMDGWYLDDIGIFIYTIPVGLSDNSEPAYTFYLEQNYPNPFNPSTKIKYTIAPPNLPKGEALEKVRLSVYDLLGREVATLVDEYKPAGIYEVEFDASESPSGIYFYKLESGSFVQVKKMILLK